MTTKPPYKRFFKEFCTQKVKANRTMKGQVVPNYREEKSRNQRITLIQLHTNKSLNNKNK
jgi:hypothetical protein